MSIGSFFMKTPLVLKMISHELFYFEKVVDLKNFGFEMSKILSAGYGWEIF